MIRVMAIETFVVDLIIEKKICFFGNPFTGSTSKCWILSIPLVINMQFDEV